VLATALKIQEATGIALTDEEVLESARDIALELCEGDSDKLCRISHMMYHYSAILAASVATRVTMATMSESDFSAMCDEIREYEMITDEVLGENN
jgi:hypothetical protein